MTATSANSVQSVVADAMREREGDLTGLQASEAEINVLTLVASGRCLLPLSRATHYAAILGIDPAQLLRIGMEQYHPGLLAEIESVLCGAPLSANERSILAGLRACRIPEHCSVGLVDGSSIAAIITREA